MTQEELGAKIGVQKSAIRKYESGLVENIPRASIKKMADIFNVKPSYLMGFEDTFLGTNALGISPLPEFKKLPLVGDIACGEPILAEQNIEEYINCPENVDATFCLRCKGDSMIGARIHDGDIVYIHQQPTIENGEIAAVLIDNEATLKRVYRQADKVILQPENPAYPPLVFVREEINQIRILGKAVCFLSNIK
jgi:repressor LexA